jgi:hypothetical protein
MGYMVSRLVNDRSISSTASLSCLLPKEIALAERMIYRLDYVGSTERPKNSLPKKIPEINLSNTSAKGFDCTDIQSFDG